MHASDGAKRILVGNKGDLADKREVSYSEGKELADHFNIEFFETSAKESINVDEAFFNLTRQIKESLEREQ